MRQPSARAITTAGALVRARDVAVSRSTTCRERAWVRALRSAQLFLSEGVTSGCSRPRVRHCIDLLLFTLLAQSAALPRASCAMLWPCLRRGSRPRRRQPDAAAARALSKRDRRDCCSRRFLAHRRVSCIARNMRASARTRPRSRSIISAPPWWFQAVLSCCVATAIASVASTTATFASAVAASAPPPPPSPPVPPSSSPPPPPPPTTTATSGDDDSNNNDDGREDDLDPRPIQ